MIDNNKYIELHRYLSNQCNEIQRIKTEAWINASAENKSFFHLINNIWVQAQNVTPPKFDYKLALQHSKRKIEIAQKHLLKYSTY